jgi:hypothetical protein
MGQKLLHDVQGQQLRYFGTVRANRDLFFDSKLHCPAHLKKRKDTNINNKLKIPANTKDDEAGFLAKFGFSGSGGTGH